jgi:hypothetical protein
VLLYRDGQLLASLEADALVYYDAGVAAGHRLYRLDIVLQAGPGNEAALIDFLECHVDVPGAPGITCAVFGGVAIPPQLEINWVPLPPAPLVEKILVYQGDAVVAELDAGATSWSGEAFAGESLYTVVARFVPPDGEMAIGSCLVDYEPPVIGGFVRGDANGDEEPDLGDVLGIVYYLFAEGAAPPCPKSADADDSGVIEATDAIRIANYLFLSGPPPAPPFPRCGHDPTGDDLPCDLYISCFNPPPP